jgi:nitrate/nitrite transport system substrate-binding protein
MGTFSNPFNAALRFMKGCVCGSHASQAEHDSAFKAEAVEAPLSADGRLTRVVESAVMRALFPNDLERRGFLKAVGASTALAAVSTIFPIATATDVFAQGGALEKKDLNVGFIPITCATPIIMAHPMGFYSKQGLNVNVVRTAGWAVIRDKTLNKEYDAAHMLAPMPLAITMGAGSNPIPYTMPAVENINGQAITLANKHRDKRDPKDWKGFRFAVPFDYSIHNYLLRYYVAEAGLDPDRDIQIRAVPPPEMVANLRADNIDGFLGPDRSTSARCSTASASSTCSPRSCGTATPAAPSPPAANSSRRCRTPTARCSRRSSRRRPTPTRPRTDARWRKRSRPPTISTSRRS